MKLSLSCLVLASSLVASAPAYADSVTSATIYTGVTDTNNADDAANKTANSANFTISGTGINYNINYPVVPNTIANFLNNPTFSNVTGTFNSTAQPTSLEIIITGTLTLTANEVLSLTHDDGASLTLQGLGEVIGSTGPTVARTDTYSGEGAGTYNFTLNYAANYLEPSVLQFQAGGVNVGQTPEPSSLMLLGTGIAAAAGMVRRRYTRSV